MKAKLLITDNPPARRSGRLVRGSVERNNLAPSDTLLGMEQRLEQAQRQRNYDREHVTITDTRPFTVRAMTNEELKAHFERKP